MGLFVAAALLALGGCRRTDGPMTILVVVNPTSVELEAGGEVGFTATVVGASSQFVRWTATCGFVLGQGRSVRYVAPEVPGPCTVTVSSDADPSASALALVTVLPTSGDPPGDPGDDDPSDDPPDGPPDDPPVVDPPPSIAVAVSPAEATIVAGGSVTFTASVDGGDDEDVGWSTTCGSVAGSGAVVAYTAPLVTAATQCVLTARSFVDPGKSASATVWVTVPERPQRGEGSVLAAGVGHALALATDGTVWAWGKNSDGQLGDGGTVGRSMPARVVGLGNVRSVGAGSGRSVALRADGSVWAWGLGAQPDGAGSALPVQVTALEEIRAIAVGNHFALALKADGTVWSWGSNENGQLGDGTTVRRSTPVQVSGLTGVVAIAAGGFHAVAQRADGSVWAWGRNAGGQVGDGTTLLRTAPVPVREIDDAVSIAAGGFHSLAVRSPDVLWAWGANLARQLGTSTNANRTTPTATLAPAGVVVADGGRDHSLALFADGAVWAWGGNEYGQVGTGVDFHVRFFPEQVPVVSDVLEIAAGSDFSLALDADGRVWAWGRSDDGQLGLVGVASRTVPTQVTDLVGIGWP